MEEALATLIQNQASFVAQMSETNKQVADLQRINSERFAHIEAMLMDHTRILAEHSRILAEHGQILERLPDAIREKIDFK